MKYAILLFAFGFFAFGFTVGDARHESDYRNGYSAGYGAGVTATRPLRNADRVVNNLLCSYAKLACVSPK